MRIGKTLIEGAPGEVRYVDGRQRPQEEGRRSSAPPWASRSRCPTAAGTSKRWTPTAPGSPPPPTWSGSATAFDAPRFGTILNAASVETMFSRPDGRAGHKADGTPEATYYACGWHVRDKQPNNGMNTWHNGYLDGATCLLVRRHDGLAWAVLFNSDTGSNGKSAAVAIDSLVHKAANAVKEWPEKDLFAEIASSRKQGRPTGVSGVKAGEISSSLRDQVC